jgi:hypothetical protein
MLGERYRLPIGPFLAGGIFPGALPDPDEDIPPLSDYDRLTAFRPEERPKVAHYQSFPIVTFGFDPIESCGLTPIWINYDWTGEYRMATPGQLMHALHAATGIPLPTIVDLDRKLVKAGLRTKGGRGLNAAQMTPRDAARLLTALLASGHANVAADAVNRYARTQCDRERSSQDQFAATELDELKSLPASHGFVDALATLIAAASTGSWAMLTASGGDHLPHIEVYAFTRATRGRIRISDLQNGLTASVEYVPRPTTAEKKGRGAPVPTAAQEVGDLEQTRRITERTIFAVAKILA